MPKGNKANFKGRSGDLSYVHCSLAGCRCPYCARDGVYSELVYRAARRDNICLQCKNVLEVETKEQEQP